MATLAIHDLTENEELDRQAMATVIGGFVPPIAAQSVEYGSAHSVNLNFSASAQNYFKGSQLFVGYPTGGLPYLGGGFGHAQPGGNGGGLGYLAGGART